MSTAVLCDPEASRQHSGLFPFLTRCSQAGQLGECDGRTDRPSRLHFLDNRLTDGNDVVSLTRRPATLYPQEDSWYSFLLEAESTPGLEGLGPVKNAITLSGIEPATFRLVCSLVPQPTTLPRTQHIVVVSIFYICSRFTPCG
jgi:hypothetical protein